MELAALSLCFLGSSGEESRHLPPVRSARITCLGGEGIKVTQFIAEFSEGDEGEREMVTLFSLKKIFLKTLLLRVIVRQPGLLELWPHWHPRGLQAA